jgi:hypothetical protein
MIQRIQSIYLLLTTILSGLFLTGNIFRLIYGEAYELVMNFRGIFEANGEDSFELIGKAIPLSLFAILVPLTSLIAILLFKNRNLQLKITLVLIIMEILLLAAATYNCVHFIRRFDASMIPGFRMFIPFITFILSILAYRGIRNDENMVRSYDRLR